ncbi:MAG: MATE family efflux transporter [Rhizobiales bacterium]|nr:MATE family efflux transporter [Hyphomicrobiales bacterium]
MTAPQTSKITHRSVLAIAVPIMLSNVTEPMIGAVNAAVIGQLPEAYYIGAITVGALIFNFIFWGFGFLRLGTGGLSAQAAGAGDTQELVAVLLRALLIAGAAGVALIVLSPAIGAFAFRLIEGSPEIEAHAATYFYIRVLSAPFALANYCLLGWFVGQARARTAFLIQIFLNLTNMVLCIIFVMGLGMTSGGVALGALIAETAAALLGLSIAFRRLRAMGARFDHVRVFDRARLIRTLAINRDIMIRTICLVFAFAWFTARGAKAGDVIVSANAVLMHFFEIAAYLIDGFAFATEALIGQAVGARDRSRFNDAMRLTWVWAWATGVVAFAIVWFGGPFFIDLMAVNPDVREVARQYLFWAALAPLVGVACFQYDGIFTGATQTADMRNMMIVSLAIYMLAWWWLEPAYGNLGLWLAMIVFFAARGVTFAMRMPALRRAAFG